MKKMKLLLAFFCLSLTLTLNAETIYLNSNGGCLDRFEYLITNTTSNSNHTVYRFSPQENTNLIFDIGAESPSILDKLPANLTSCKAISSWNDKTIKRINSQELVVFIVKQTPQGYKLSKVNSGAWFQKVGQRVNYFNSDFDFVADLSNISYSNPISSARSSSEITLTNYALYDCSTVLTLHQSPNTSKMSSGNFQFIPEFGMTSYAEGYDVNKSTNRMQLMTINGRDFNAYLSDDCTRRGFVSNYNTTPSSGRVTQRIITGSDIIPANAIYTGHIGLDETLIETAYVAPSTPAPYETVVVKEEPKGVVIIEEKKEKPVEVFTAREIPTSYVAVEKKIVVEAPNPCGASAEQGYHLVQKGETLYSLVRKYGIPLTQIKTWNGLKKDLIHPCTSLRVSKNAAPNPAVVDYSTPRKTEVKPTAPASTPIVKSVAVQRPTSAPIEEFTSKGAETIKQTDMSWLNQSDAYTVKEGETLANIAGRFGYTEERFRYINGMNANQTLRIGQKLRTTDCNCVVTPQPYESTDNAILTEKGTFKIAAVTPALTSKEIPASYTEYTEKSVPSSYDLVTVAPNGRKIHIVKREDTLFSLAKMYDTSVDAIMSLNGLDKGEIIIPAQRLYVK